jgi:hypothetical protein
MKKSILLKTRKLPVRFKGHDTCYKFELKENLMSWQHSLDEDLEVERKCTGKKLEDAGGRCNNYGEN